MRKSNNNPAKEDKEKGKEKKKRNIEHWFKKIIIT